MSLVQFNKVYKQFAGEYILKDINFTIEEKDKIGLVGVNGAGKSTIIRMLLDRERIDGAKEIYDKIFQLLKKEQNHLLNRYENDEIDYDSYVELSSARYNEYQEYVKELALAYDNELNEKMAFVINANLETF